MLFSFLIAGLPVTAAHAYEGNPYAALVNTTAVVRFNNIDWYLIEDNSSAADAGTVTLLTKECMFVSKYRADGTTGEYKGSTVEENVNKYYKEQFSAVRHAVADNRLFLLTHSEANAVNVDIRKCAKHPAAYYNVWWLNSYAHSTSRSPMAQGVNGDTGATYKWGAPAYYYVGEILGVRPCVKINLAAVTFSPESRTFTPIPAEMLDLSKAKISAIPDQIYTGKAIKPELTVTLKGKALTPNTDYKVSFKYNKNIGKASVKITGTGIYSGKKTASFKILPKKVSLSSLTAGKKSLTVKWKAGAGIDGYQIEYSLNKDFRNSKKVTVKGKKTTEYEIKKLWGLRTYYVRIRAYKQVLLKTYYSEWSKVLSEKTKLLSK